LPLAVVLADPAAGIEIVIGWLCPGRVDLVLFEALARLRLAARRGCWAVHLRGVAADLRPIRDLLAYFGVEDLFAFDEEPYAAGVINLANPP
jgi:hypothetical protein